MQEVATTANLVDYETLVDDSIAAVIARSELEAALAAHEAAGLWFELEHEDDAESRRLTLSVTSAEIEEILRFSPGDEIILALDGDQVSTLFADPDVSAHGLRGAFAIAVATAAIAAPASLAATPQVSSQVSPQISPQVSSQISKPATKAQVVRPGTHPAATAQVRSQVVKTHLNKGLVVKAAGINLLRGTSVR
jgi:hypothetical protein